jgi:hypothetical protein
LPGVSLSLSLLSNSFWFSGNIAVQIPLTEENGITTHFNRAVVSSQALQKTCPALTTPSQQKAARAWLGNGMEQAVPEFLGRAAGKDIEGAIYHLTDETWIIPALQHYGGSVSLAYNQTSNDHTSNNAITAVAPAAPRLSFRAVFQERCAHRIC